MHAQRQQEQHSWLEKRYQNLIRKRHHLHMELEEQVNEMKQKVSMQIM
jgi:hypothetical protein